MAAAVLAAIIAALWLTEILVDMFSDRRMLDGIFFLSFLVMIAALATHGFRLWPRRLELGIIIAVCMVYLQFFLRMNSPYERSHVIEYAVLAILVFEALRERNANGKAIRRPGLAAFCIVASIGLLDELAQLFIPARVFDYVDILFNVMAAGVAVIALLATNWVRNRIEKKIRRPGRSEHVV